MYTHVNCYQADTWKEGEDWFCRMCRGVLYPDVPNPGYRCDADRLQELRQKFQKTVLTPCIFCGQTHGGAFTYVCQTRTHLPVLEGVYAHMSCALWCTGVYMRRAKPFALAKSRWQHERAVAIPESRPSEIRERFPMSQSPCSICKTTKGCVIKCSSERCKSYFHASCAILVRCSMQLWNGQKFVYSRYCPECSPLHTF
jgi:hypothetical protein